MMITAISSFRPFSDCSPEIESNQILAKRSWDRVFSDVIYFGPFQLDLAGPKTTFISVEPWPHISLLMHAAALTGQMACIINADIVVTPALLDGVQTALKLGAASMTSERYEFDPVTGDFSRARVVDLGIDFFCATPEVWKDTAMRVPSEFRIGHNRWDSWLSSYWNMSLGHRFVSLRKFRAVFHPKHGDRKQPYEIKFTHDYWSSFPGFPRAI